MADKQDHLRLCNEQGLPFTEFMANWCSRCFQPECSRSLHGKTRFDARISSWEERLFLNPSKLDSSDPRYRDIATKKFLAMAPTNPAERSAWMDPRDVETTKVISIPTPAPEPPPPPPPEPKVEASPPVRGPEQASTPPQVLTNTPNRPRQMIAGAAVPPPPLVSDPWRPMQPVKPGETVVKPGARIKFGS